MDIFAGTQRASAIVFPASYVSPVDWIAVRVTELRGVVALAASPSLQQTDLSYGRTTALNDVELPAVVKPSGVTTEIMVEPASEAVNSPTRASPEPPGMVTDEAIVPTAGLLFFRVT
jgi:hypothetical protein